ncbi:type II toxin-antitoxin system HicA family toxin [Microbispora sp. NBRC 16548]|uniref:type II toxin-antitoxin system HicA family toxin n=1 Tax=Microbispora sp. NBRC 16548 TaxID=3030994 RepID=UPI003322B8FC
MRALEKCGFEVVATRGSHCKLRQVAEDETRTVIVHSTTLWPSVRSPPSCGRLVSLPIGYATCCDHAVESFRPLRPSALALPAIHAAAGAPAVSSPYWSHSSAATTSALVLTVAMRGKM